MIDSAQHFIDVKGQNNLIKTERTVILTKDIAKMNLVIDKYPIVRLYQPNIYRKKYDWELLINSPINLVPNTLYVRQKEKEIYTHHTAHFNTIYL